MANTTNTKLRLSWEWIVILILAGGVISGIKWIPKLLEFSLDAGAQVALIVGGCALAASAYAAFTANRMKHFEIQRGYQAARSIVQVDAQEALGESQNVLDSLLAHSDDDKEEWNHTVSELSVLERRYERRQDQLAFLSTHFSPADFLAVQTLYLAILRMFRRADQFLIDDRTAQRDVPGIIASRKEELRDVFKSDQRSALGKYQSLELASLPPELNQRLTQR